MQRSNLIYSIVLLLLLIASSNILAQSNEHIQYKGIAWYQGGVLNDEILVVKAGIKAGDSFLYQETQTVTTDENGFYSLFIGSGESIDGYYSQIEWSAVNIKVQVEIDKLFNGTGFQIVADSRLLSVPYANYCEQIISKKGPTGPTGLNSCADIQNSYTGNTGATGFAPWQAGDDATINSNLKVGIGTNEPSAELEVAGNICYTGIAGSCSDKRFKTDIEKLESSLEKLLQVNGYTYSWNKEDYPEKQFQDKKQAGVIAQELEEFYPELVNTDQKGLKSVNYSKLSALILASKQEQDKEIAELMLMEDQLSNRIEKLEKATAQVD